MIFCHFFLLDYWCVGYAGSYLRKHSNLENIHVFNIRNISSYLQMGKKDELNVEIQRFRP